MNKPFSRLYLSVSINMKSLTFAPIYRSFYRKSPYNKVFMKAFFKSVKVVYIHKNRSIRNDPDAGLCLNGGNKLYIFNSFLRMKLVLKFQEEVKLFTGSLEYDDVVAFICREFNIAPPSLHISFLDQDNDDITILSNEDIDVMQALFEGKEYVKVNVTGEVNVPQPKEEKVEEVQIKLEVIPVEEEKVEEPELIEVNPAEIEEKPEQALLAEEKEPEEPRCLLRGSKQWSHHEERRKAFENVESYLNEAVAKLVDQRVKALLPCLKEQILNHEAKKAQPKGLVHEGTECKGCLVKPIVGIRYECPTCPEFSLCENCEQKIEHDHNLLKIKKLVEKKEQDRPGFGHCLKRFFKHGHHGHRGRSSSSSRDKCHWKSPHWAMRKLWGLSMMFGGKPEDYRSFVDENKHLRPRETFKKYADLQGLTDEDFKQRFIDMRCQKLANNFGKPAQEYRAFVEENYESRYRDLVCKLEEKGEKSDGRKCRWGKRYNFNDSCEKECSPRKEEVAKAEPEVKEEPKKEDSFKEEPKKEEKIQITDSMLEMPVKETPEVAREKGFILTQMQEVFGKENTKEYFKLINQHYKEGLQGVVHRWIEQLNLSLISK